MLWLLHVCPLLATPLPCLPAAARASLCPLWMHQICGQGWRRTLLTAARARATQTVVSGFLCSSRQHLFQAPSSSGNSAAPSIYLGKEQSPKGDFAGSCKKGTLLLQPGKSSTESDHRRQGFNSRGATASKTENTIEWNYWFALSLWFN